MRTILPRVLLACLLGMGAEAQTLRSAVVPPGAAVVIPPRGQAAPAALPAPTAAVAAVPPVATVSPVPAAPLAATAPMGLGALPLAVLPLAAAALLGGALPGSGGGASAPATTR
jgi:hypothetical protein